MSNSVKKETPADPATPAASPGPTDVVAPADSAAGSNSETSPSLQEVQAKAALAGEYWDRYLRLAAEFDNFKKRAARERQESLKHANAALLERLLPVLDHFEMALAAAANSDDPAVINLKTGIAMVLNQLQTVLNEAGLVEIETLNQPFDPTWHQAMMQQATDVVPEGHIVQQLRKGYKLSDRLLRPAGVVVAQTPAKP